MPPKATKTQPMFDHDDATPIAQIPAQNINYEEIAKLLITQMGHSQNQTKPKQKRVLTEERKQVLRDQLAKGREKSIHTRTMTRKPEIEPVKVPEPAKTIPIYSHEKIDELITNIKELTQVQRDKIQKRLKLEKEKEEKEEDDKFLFLPQKKQVQPQANQQATQQAKPQVVPMKPVITPPAKPSIYYVPRPNNRIF